MIKLRKKNLLRFNLKKIKDKKVVVRVDYNIDYKNGKISDKFRLTSTRETLEKLKIAKSVILISHFGDPQGFDSFYSFKNVLPQLQKILKLKINFLEDFSSKPLGKFNLLENIRFFRGEKEKDINLAYKIKDLGEIYINEAFSVSHRDHTSITLVPKLMTTFYGLRFEKEIKMLNEFLKLKNLTLILGGAKISTKLPLIKKFLKKAKLIILGGGLANTFLKAKGFNVGQSLVEDEILDEIKKIDSKNILTPIDFFTDKGYRKLNEIKNDDKILDVGFESLKIFLKEISKNKNIIWNGPLGYIEEKKYINGTYELAKNLIKFKNKKILIGGGDTISFLEEKKLLKKFKFISTGGGAMLYYLAEETLPCFKNE